MTLFDRLYNLHRLLHRYTSYRAEVGLRRLGEAGPDSPVLVTGNYEHTVERLEETLQGRSCWLLVADSAGINVWCAAGVGDFNEHKITDAVIATRLADQVRHRRLILPPLAAVGVDLRKLREFTGFSGGWGPVHLEDLPAFLDLPAGPRPEAMRLARFPLRDRIEEGVGIMGVFSFFLVLAFHWPRQAFWFFGSILHAAFGTLLAYDRLPPRFPANKTVLLGLLQFLGLCFWHRHDRDRTSFRQRVLLGAAAHALIAIDMIGSTPFFKTTIGHWLTTGDNRSLFQPKLNERCTACGQCLEVCPKGIFSRNAERRIAVDLGRECCECLACIKQCPCEAIDNAGTGFKDDVKSVPGVERLHRLVR